MASKATLRRAPSSSCRLLCACSPAAAATRFNNVHFVFLLQDKRGKIRSEGCEQIRGWAHGKNIK